MSSQLATPRHVEPPDRGRPSPPASVKPFGERGCLVLDPPYEATTVRRRVRVRETLSVPAKRSTHEPARGNELSAIVSDRVNLNVWTPRVSSPRWRPADRAAHHRRLRPRTHPTRRRGDRTLRAIEADEMNSQHDRGRGGQDTATLAHPHVLTLALWRADISRPSHGPFLISLWAKVSHVADRRSARHNELLTAIRMSPPCVPTPYSS